ncbi:MAG: SGNH/GDSL hydrolase family protein [Propionicimonas sp.]
MQRRIITSLIALAASTCITLGSTASIADAHAPKPKPQPVYVALGDSYAAGLGSGAPFDVNPDCLRSVNAYPSLLDQKYPRLGSLDFEACSLVNNTIAGLAAQVSPNALAKVVTLTIGGNDIGFVPVLTSCLNQPPNTACKNDPAPAPPGWTVEMAVNAALEALPGGLSAALQQIQAAYPNAKIYVSGYPRLLNRFGKVGTSLCTLAPGVTVQKMDAVWLNQVADKLNGKIRLAVAQAKKQDVRVKYVDVSKAFNGHGLCGGGSSWIDPVTGHTTARGQKAYAQQFHAAGVGK